MQEESPDILKQLKGHLRWLHPLHAPRTHAVVLMLVAGLSLTAAMVPNRNEASTNPAYEVTAPERSVHKLALEITAPAEDPAVSAATTQTPEAWLSFRVARGDTLGKLFQKAGIPASTLHKVIASHKKASRISNLKAGQEIAFLIDENNELQKFKVIKSRLENIIITREGDRFRFEEVRLVPTINYGFASITIDSSLFQSAQKTGISDNLTMELANVFGWDIDFVLDIRQGDTFNFVYENLIIDGEKIGHGDIVAAEFVTRVGATYQAVRYTDEKGVSRYFTPTGMSMRKEFLRTPVDFAQISSHFNLKRKHPVLHKIRAHKGTDYAAETGTPVRATGNGRVSFVGRKGGYGNTIILQHGTTYETLYAHLSKYARNLKEGSKVAQGQVIGYVGSSGLATGPHLHYEFHVNGVQRNPVTVRFPNSSPISSDERPRFQAQTQNYMMRLASYTHKLTPTQIALAE